MTALDQYIRLETTGIWREAPELAPREVLVSFGNATLVLSDFSEHPLTHWSLAAVCRIGDGPAGVVYAPDAGSAETLEVADPQMIDAIAAVSRQVRAGAIGTVAPRRKRGLRGPMLAAAVVLAVAAAAAWGPDALRKRAFSLIPQDHADLVAADIVAGLDAPRCDRPRAARALARLTALAAPDRVVEIRDWDRPLLARLPDGRLLLGRALTDGPNASPEALAGWLALAAQLAPDDTPLAAWIADMEIGQVVGFLAAPDIGSGDIARMVSLLRASDFVPTADQLTAARAGLTAAGISDEPFLDALRNRIPHAPATDPGPQPDKPRPALSDQDWVALQEICAS